MSFLETIKNKKLNLSHTKTTLKTVDGTVFEVDLKEGSREFKSSTYGFVVDTKPDLAVASVLPGLLMGSQDVTHNQSLLKQYEITHILSLGIEVPKFPGYFYTYIESLDLPEFCILNIFQNCFYVINKVRNEGKTIYVHCNAGVSRSAAVIIGYLMKECDMDYKSAYGSLRNARPCIRPNDGFVKQLLLYEKSLKN